MRTKTGEELRMRRDERMSVFRIFGKIGEVAKDSYTGLNHFMWLLKERVTLEAREFLLQWMLSKAMDLSDIPRMSVRSEKRENITLTKSAKYGFESHFSSSNRVTLLHPSVPQCPHL